MRNTIPFPARPDGRPLCIAHRGASAHAVENTLEAFRVAAALGAEMWEIDVWLTADGHPVVAHDADLSRVFGTEGNIAELTLDHIREHAPRVPTLDEVINLARDVNSALYIEIKGRGAGLVSIERLKAREFTAAGLGSFQAEEVRAMANSGCPYPLSVLVPLHADAFDMAERGGADIIHLCWERGGARPQDLVTPELIARAEELGLGIVLWHEERRSVLNDLMGMPVLGICTNQPELMHGCESVEIGGMELVCHRGANYFAPENTIAAARLCLDQGCHYIELDVRESSDGELVVIHDASVDRTTNGSGAVADFTLAQLRRLDAGCWFSDHFAGQKIPTLAEMISLCQSYGRKMYIENKSADPAKIIALVEQMDFAEHCFHWSGDTALSARIRAISPQARIKAESGDLPGMAALEINLDPQIFEILLTDYPGQADEAKARGMVPMLQYFGDDPEAFDRIVDYAPPLINLERADLFLAALRRRAEAQAAHEQG